MSAVSIVAVASHTVARTVSVIATRRWPHDNYVQVCHRLNIPLQVVKYDGVQSSAFRSDVFDTVEVLFASLPFDKWANCAEDWELQILMKGI